VPLLKNTLPPAGWGETGRGFYNYTISESVHRLTDIPTELTIGRVSGGIDASTLPGSPARFSRSLVLFRECTNCATHKRANSRLRLRAGLFRGDGGLRRSGMDKVQVAATCLQNRRRGRRENRSASGIVYSGGSKKGRAFPAVILISGGGVEGGDHDWRNAGVYKSYGRIRGCLRFAASLHPALCSRAVVAERDRRFADLVGTFSPNKRWKLSLDKDTWRFGVLSAGGFCLPPVLG